MNEAIIERLLHSDEPAVRFKTLVNVLGMDSQTESIRQLREEIKASERSRLLLSERNQDGVIPFHPYAKWYGAHWVLATLADLGYPPADQSLIPLREQVLGWLLSSEHTQSLVPHKGRIRIHASMEGNAIYALHTLGLADERVDELVERLLSTQWPDGGWNCDRDASGSTSSFMETLLPFRALAIHGNITGDNRAQAAARAAAEVFLKRRLYKRQRDGSIMRYDFTSLHYPCYWHYDILFALKVMEEAGFIGDARCSDAINLLESKRLPDGGFPAEKKYYHHRKSSADRKSGSSLVTWGSTVQTRMNEFVTTDALSVLKAAG